MSPRGIFTHVEIILQLLDCLGQVNVGLYKFCIWVELPVQRRLPDFREKCRVTRHSRVFRRLTGSQRTPGFWGVTRTSPISDISDIFIPSCKVIIT